MTDQMSRQFQQQYNLKQTFDFLRQFVFAQHRPEFPGYYNPEELRHMGHEMRQQNIRTFHDMSTALKKYLNYVADRVEAVDPSVTRWQIKKLAASAMFLHFDCFRRLLGISPHVMLKAVQCLQQSQYSLDTVRAAADWIQDLGLLNWEQERGTLAWEKTVKDWEKQARLDSQRREEEYQQDYERRRLLEKARLQAMLEQATPEQLKDQTFWREFLRGSHI